MAATSVSNQIPTWLLHQELWRFLGFVSIIFGLLFYALSSSFNHLFGNWNFTKLIVYTVLSFIICFAILFPKLWQHSPSKVFKVHMTFLVLTITSVYSFFFDKAVNGTPDAYSVVSCVAFAMTMVSLSRQIHCGLEVDLLYFFLGALIGQLMKIKKWLAVVGVLFSYLLIVLRSSLAATRENGYRLLPDPNPVVVQVDSEQSNFDNALLMTRLPDCIEELRQRNSALINIISAHVKEYVKDIDDSKLMIDYSFVIDVLPFRVVDDLGKARIRLLSFSDSFASQGHSMDRMFQNLYIFVTLRDLIPEFQTIFIDGQSLILVNEATTVQNKLREAILASYTEMRNLIFDTEVSKLVTSDGGVHLMIRDAMNFIIYCCHSREKLEPILNEYLEGADGAGTSSSFSIEMVSILELLERKLESISKSYEDTALPYFFMMNNRKQIENQIKKWDLGTYLSDDWVQNNTGKIQQNLELYYMSSWNKVLDYLKLDKDSWERNVAAESMKDRLSMFNKNFKEICTVQSRWFVEDEKLREEIITNLENIVSVAYGNFIRRFLDVLATNASECIMYGIDDIEARLKALFRPSWMYNELVA